MYVRKLKKQVICDYGQAEVKTREGILRGVISDGTFVFRGVDYAKAERFGMPKPVEPWEGVKEAIVYGFCCPEIFTPVPHDQFNVPHYFGVQGEDCQNLNIWTNSIDENAKKPVMVWLHGGGYFSGSGIEHYAYDGENLAKEGDVVVVTVTHRLNILGFLDLSAYGEEYKNSGNLGMADLVAALEWVKNNTAAFGGDPENVMISGQSGGGGKVATLLQMPAADGLYKKAVLQSGGMTKGREITKEIAKRTAELVLEYLKIEPENIGKIKEVCYDELAEAANFAQQQMEKETGKRMMWGPVCDGEYYMGHPLEVGFRETAKNIPILCGTVLGEFMNNFASPKGEGSKNSWTEAYKKEMLESYFGEKTAELEKAFLAAYPEKTTADLLFMDISGRKAALEFARAHSKMGGAATFNYIFTWESQFNGGTVAWHNAEIPYIFRNADYLEPSFTPGETETLQEIVSSSWVNFAKNGDPNGGVVPEWKAITENEHYTMIFDRESKLALSHDADLLSLMPEVTVSLAGLMGKKK